MSAIVVGALRVEPGAKLSGEVPVLRGPVTTVVLPVTIVNGRPGPCLVLLAGVHGSDYPGIEAAVRYARELTPDRLRGSVVIFPLVNPQGFEDGEAYRMPIDGQNLNRLFPGDPAGLPSNVVAHGLFSIVTAIATHVIDLHGGDTTEHLEPFAIYYETGDQKVDQQSAMMAQLYDTPRIWAMKHPFGHQGTSFAEFSKVGIPAIAGEAGYLGTCNEAEIEVHMRGVLNIMKAIGIVDGDPARQHEDQQEIFRKDFTIRTRHAGIFEAAVGPSKPVAQGEYLGRIRTLYGDTLEEIRSPTSGTIRTLFPKRVVQTGDIVYRGWER